MNFWINGNKPELLETIKHWDFLLINDSEARMLAEENNSAKRRKRFSQWVRIRW